MNTKHRQLAPWCVGLLGLLLCAAGAALGLSVAGCGNTEHPPEEGFVSLDDEFKLPPGPPIFEEVTKETGVDWKYRNGEEKKHLAIIESLGGGVGLFDFDGDGLLDLFVVGGGDFEKRDEDLVPKPKDPRTRTVDMAALAKMDRSCAILGHPCKLYKNLGNWKFEDVTDQVIKLDGPWFYSHGCAVGDFDCDGWPDLLVTGWGRVALFHNEPDPKDPTKRRLVDVTAKSKLLCDSWSSSAGFADLDGDGYPDLYICCYGDWSWKNHPDCSYDGKTPDVCPPKNFNGLKHKLFLNNRDGTFTDVSDTVEVLVRSKDSEKDEVMKGLRPGGKDASKGLGVLIADLNRDGKPDIYVANDTVDNFLYFNLSTPGTLKFAEKALENGTARDDRGFPNGSMGLDLADYDRCGLPSLFVTNYEGEKHALYHNDWKLGDGPDRHFFSHRSNLSRISTLGQIYVGWGTGFVDFEHRGWEDLIIVNGHAIHKPQGKNVTVEQRPVLLRNMGDSDKPKERGTFKDWSDSGGRFFKKVYRSRGLALGDIDNDGKVDAVVSNMNAPVAILKNVANTDGNHWLGIDLVGEKNRDVVGARLSLKVGEHTQWRFTKGGGSYLSARDPRHVFGLGKENKVGTLTVVWPNGKEQTWEGLAVDRYYRLTQGQKEAKLLPGAKK